MKDLEKVLRSQFSTNFDIVFLDSSLLIRDNDIEKGMGYIIKIDLDLRFIYAKIDFEDFSHYLKKQVKKHLLINKGLISELVLRHTEFNAITEGHYIKQISDQVTQTTDNWWFKFEFKLNKDSHRDKEKFAQILFSCILLLFPYQFESEEEGLLNEVTSTLYERSPVNRALCIAYHGYHCKACNLNMCDTYNGIGKEFIHVHHVNPLSKSGNYIPDPVNDLIPLCPNCHSVAHFRSPPYSVSEISQMINKRYD